jgi:hypothetical protein
LCLAADENAYDGKPQGSPQGAGLKLSIVRSILTDLQFWIPAAVLVAAASLLLALR